MTNPPDERGAELRELFFETSQELLQALNEESLKLEKNPGDEEIVRSHPPHGAHAERRRGGLRVARIKRTGAPVRRCAFAGRRSCAWSAVAEIAFAAADVFAEMLAAYHGGRHACPPPTALCKRINELTATPAAKKARRKKKSVARPETGQRLDRCRKTRDSSALRLAGLALYEVVVKIDPLCAMPIAARQLIQNAISGDGPGAGGAARTRNRQPPPSKWSSCFASATSQEQIAAKCQIPTDRRRCQHHLDRRRAEAPQTLPSECRRYRKRTADCSRSESLQTMPRNARPIVAPAPEPQTLAAAARPRKTFCAWMRSASTTCSIWWASSSSANRCCSRR